MRSLSAAQGGKVKVSAAVLGWTLKALERFRRESGLRTRSAALSEALAQWARDYLKEAAVEKALAKYGGTFRSASGRETAQTGRLLPLVNQVRGR